MKIRFVTSNPGKLREAQDALGPLGVEVEGSSEPVTEIQADDLAAVAEHKAVQLRGRVEPPYFLEDAGLFVDGLGGFPGVYSAYAFRTIGNQGILDLLAPRNVERSATFRAVIALIESAHGVRRFEGSVAGRIPDAPRGRQGFGFDPIFIPEGWTQTFAELGAEEKGRISHRGRALAALARHLLQTRKVSGKPNNKV